jgi:DNA-binding XRE family transcriptional regulator
VKRIVKDRSISELLPEFHPTKNGGLRLQDLTPRSSKKVWWICSEGHEWQTRVYCRTRGTNCPYCFGREKNKLPLNEWVSRNKKIGLGKVFRKVKDTPDGVLVEMPLEAWHNLAILTISPQHLGDLIREYRRRKGLSQEQFAGIVGHHRNYIWMIESGEFKKMTYKDYQRIMTVILE